MQQSSFQEANRFSAGQEIPRILRNPKVNYSASKYYAYKLTHELLKNQMLIIILVFKNRHLVFKNWYYVLPEDGTNVPKHAGKAYLMFVPF